MRLITYNLPPYVERIANPHYESGDAMYAEYKLRSLGDYPIGTYTVGGHSSFTGSFIASASTNTSVTLIHPGLPTDYPAKETVEFMDVNEYEFAHTSYGRTQSLDPAGLYRGQSNETKYDPLIFDYDAFPGQDTASYNIYEIATTLTFNVAYAADPGKLYYPGDSIEDTITSMWGYEIAYLPELPGFDENDVADPTIIDLIPVSTRDQIIGRYLIVMSYQYGEGFSYDIYPPLPINRNVDIRIESFGPDEPDVTNGYAHPSGKIISVRYDSLYSATTGPGFGIVLPYKKKRNFVSTTLPVLISCSDLSDDLAYRFYTNNALPFDLYRGTGIPLQGTPIADKTLPANLKEIARS